MTGKTDSNLLHGLREWKQQEENLPPSVRFYGELLQIQNAAKSRIVVEKPNCAVDLVRDRLSQGIPVLLFDDFSPDWRQVQTLFSEVTAWINKDSRTPPAENQVHRRICHDISLITRLAECWYMERSSKGIVQEDGIDNELLDSIIAATMKPFLTAYASLLLPEVDQELWRRRYCPVCGGKPDFAYLDKNTGARWLLCSRCDSGWLFVRMECPYCGTQNQDALTYFTDEGQPLYRLYVCEECHTYIKAVDLRHTSSVVFPLERVYTLSMDRQAQENGYKPGI